MVYTSLEPEDMENTIWAYEEPIDLVIEKQEQLDLSNTLTYNYIKKN